MPTLLGLFAATFVSEDLACITAGLLIQRGEIPATGGIATCALGIFAGDLGLWMLGRIAAALSSRSPRVARVLEAERTGHLRVALERHAAAAILASRFVPGTRLPLYLTAGGVRMSPLLFGAWTLIAAFLWTPALVLTAAGVGSVTMMAVPFGTWSTAVAAAAMVVTVVLRRTRTGRTAEARLDRLASRLARWRRWEFWPMWLFYAPVALRVAWLSITTKGLSTITAANPGISDGGTVGESKSAILANLPAEWVIPWALVPEGGTPASRARQAREIIAARHWPWPVVVKPDIGQRGAGVRLVHDLDQVADYLQGEPRAVIVQPYHDGPFEAGVFYYRFPHQPRGRIFSITDKHFPVIVGDGRSTVAELIRMHPRYRLQADLFLRRHDRIANLVLTAGQRQQLAVAGNHCQGTMFRNGAHLKTAELEARIDAIARAFPGFFVGRFDVRYRDVEAFMAGRDLAIVELNGATSESTSIYDPSTSLLDAYRELFTQWSLAFAIGAANRKLGAPVSSTRRLITLLAAHVSAPAPAISD